MAYRQNQRTQTNAEMNATATRSQRVAAPANGTVPLDGINCEVFDIQVAGDVQLGGVARQLMRNSTITT